MPDNHYSDIYTLISALKQRTGRSYQEACDRIAADFGITEYDRSTFDNKFRRRGRNPKYHLDEVLALIRAYYRDLPKPIRCSAYEAIQIIHLTGLSKEHPSLKDIFGEAQYEAGWDEYLQKHIYVNSAEREKQPAEDDSKIGHVFVSYSDKDAAAARRLVQFIESSGYRVWQDITAIPGGREWIREIEQGINGSCALAVITSAHLTASYWVWEEILHAQRRHKKIIPFVIDNSPLPFGILQVNSIDAYVDFDDAAQKLIKTLEPCSETGVNTTKLSHRQLEIDYLDRVLLEHGVWKTAYAPMAGTALQAAAPGNTDKIKTVNMPLEIITDFDLYIEERLNTPQKIDYQDNILRAINDLRQFILLGEPGGGKTATLWHIAASFAEAAKADEKQPLPILVKLGEIEEHQSVRAKIIRQLGTLAPSYDDLIKAGRVALLIDGLNEISQKAFAEIFNEIRSIAKTDQAQKLILVISCRTLDYTPDVEIDLAGQVTIKPLDPLRIRQIINNYIEEPVGKGDELFWALAGENAHKWWDRFVRDIGNEPEWFWLYDTLPDGRTWGYGKADTRFYYWNQWLAIRRQPERLFELARNPFLLHMLLRVFVKYNRLPTNRSKLLDGFIDFLLTRREGSSSTTAREVADKLTALAYSMQQSGDPGLVSVESARQQLGDEVVFRLAQSASILESDGRFVQFTHQLLQEYFAAQQLNQQLDVSVSAVQYWSSESWWQKNRWDESAILLTGFYETDTSPVITWLQDANPEIAARCIMESGSKTPDALVDLLVTNWVKRLDKTPIAARASVGRALGILDRDPRIGVGLTSEGLPEIDWIEIPGGEFIYGDHENGYLDAFAISRYPITYRQFQTFIDAPDGFYNPVWWEGLARHEQTPGIQEFRYANHPRERVNWYDAVTFCRWLSHHLGFTVSLPTEYQWEKAARGSEGYRYPYGNEFDVQRGNVDETGIGKTCAVGIFPEGASPYGVLDMSGNVFEWCLNPAETPDRINLSGADRRSLRGGSWAHSHEYARADYRYANRSELRRNRVGFRVVR